jgi:hypothetical protein
LKLVYPNQWMPSRPRLHDIFLMEFFQCSKATQKELEILNKSRIYLQAITLSDIASTDGITILPSAIQGHPTVGCHSNLDWPHQGRPPRQACPCGNNTYYH